MGIYPYVAQFKKGGNATLVDKSLLLRAKIYRNSDYIFIDPRKNVCLGDGFFCSRWPRLSVRVSVVIRAKADMGDGPILLHKSKYL